MRDIGGFVETRKEMLALKPGQEGALDQLRGGAPPQRRPRAGPQQALKTYQGMQVGVLRVNCPRRPPWLGRSGGALAEELSQLSIQEVVGICHQKEVMSCHAMHGCTGCGCGRTLGVK